MAKPSFPAETSAELPAIDPATRWWLFLQLGVGGAVWAAIVAAISLVV